MAKKRKGKIGAKGPTPKWLKLSVAQRAALKEDIKRGFQGEDRNGIKIPGVRRVFTGYGSDDGYDLRHIERWSSAKLDRARHDIAVIRTLTSRLFDVKIPTTKTQKKRLRSYTGQKTKRQKSFIVHKDSAKEKVRFVKGHITLVKSHEGRKERSYRRLYLFEDYSEYRPIDFEEMAQVTQLMLPDMPDKIKGRNVFYGLYTVQTGVIGRLVLKKNILSLLEDYHHAYDAKFAGAILGYYMVGTEIQIKKAHEEKRKYKSFFDPTKKLKFYDKPRTRPTNVSSKKTVAKSIRKSVGVRPRRKATRRR